MTKHTPAIHTDLNIPLGLLLYARFAHYSRDTNSAQLCRARGHRLARPSRDLAIRIGDFEFHSTSSTWICSSIVEVFGKSELFDEDLSCSGVEFWCLRIIGFKFGLPDDFIMKTLHEGRKEKTHHVTCVEAVVRVQFGGGVASEEEIFIYEMDCANRAKSHRSILISDRGWAYTHV